MTTENIHSKRVIAPAGFSSANCSMLEFIERAKLFVKAMDGLNRATVLSAYKGDLFLSSVPVETK